MITTICNYMMNPWVVIILLLLPVTTSANQLVAAVGGRGDGDNVVTKKCFDVERRTLLDFKAQFQHSNHDSECLTSWTAEEDECCSWFGVTCNYKTGHVNELDLNMCGLGGEINHSLLNLSYLNHLDLSSNSFEGSIPMFICSLTRLRYLDLSKNSFNGSIPWLVGSLTKLTYLNLRTNDLNGTIPRSIGSLTELTHLYLSNNSLSGVIPPEFGNLTNLQELDLGFVGSCRVENLVWLTHLLYLKELAMDGISLAKANQWVNVISSLPKLTWLSLDGCELSEVMYPYSSFLNSSSSIHTLFLANNNLNSSMYRWLFPLTSTKLLFLDLSSNMLDGIPKYIGNLCSLGSLKFDNISAVIQFPDFLNNLSGCTSLSLQWLYAPGSHFTGSLSDDIQKFSSLTYLDLSHNQLNGTISEKLWELPRLDTLDISSNYLKGTISKTIGKSKPHVINLSKNSLEGIPSTDHMSNLSYVQYIDLSSCKIGPHFPKWIHTLKNLNRLDISNTRISDTIPLEFWNTWPSQLRYLNISSNNISGDVPDLSSNFDINSVIDMSSNNFYGLIPDVPSTLTSLDLSKNKFYGEISFLCQIVGGLLEFLDLSHNFLSGQLPDCLWHFKLLKALNLGHNNLSGRLPPSIGSMIELEVLDLYNNNFSVEFPLSLKNCTSLNLLNLGANKFSSDVPIWIGGNLFGLYVLILRSNNFFGTIPLGLCQLPNLHILDLSMNKLHGLIPSCLSNVTSMVEGGLLQPKNIHLFSIPWSTSGGTFYVKFDIEYVDRALIKWQGDEREFIRNLGLLKSIDLSSNNLTSQIPYEITNLYELISLNLSRNALRGEIPWKIGQMQNLLTLDLSRNNFSGKMPSSMSKMTLLNDLNVSFNNLSGRIPSSTQLQSFEPSRYNGNFGLCGPPITKICPGDEESKVPPVVGKTLLENREFPTSHSVSILSEKRVYRHIFDETCLSEKGPSETWYLQISDKMR